MKKYDQLIGVYLYIHTQGLTYPLETYLPKRKVIFQPSFCRDRGASIGCVKSWNVKLQLGNPDISIDIERKNAYCK